MPRLSIHLLFLTLFSCASPAAEPTLDNLHQLTEEEKAGRSITLTASIPSYTETGERIAKKDWGTYLTDKTYTPDIYTDAKGAIKAVVFKKGVAPKAVQLPEDAGINRVGKQAPAFTAKDLDGNTIRLDDLKGKVVVLNFWFVACKPCVLEMPDLNALQDKYKGADVVFLGLTFDKEAEVRGFLNGTHFTYTIIPDSKGVHALWGVAAYPTNIVIDKKGTVRYMNYGLDRETRNILDREISRAL